MEQLLVLLLLVAVVYASDSQVSQFVHPAVLDGPQNEVIPSLVYPSNRVGVKSRLRSRVFRDASQGYKQLIDSPRLFRASGRFHKRVQSATTHDIQNVPLPDSVQIVSYKYDAEKHNEKKMSENDILSDSEVEDHARSIERTTMAMKIREEDDDGIGTTEAVTISSSSSTTTSMPEHNSINEIKETNQQRPKTFFQTVTANGNSQQPPAQPPVVFTASPPISPPTFTMPNLIPPSIQQQNLPSQPSQFVGINPINIPHQPTNPLVGFQPTLNPPIIAQAAAPTNAIPINQIPSQIGLTSNQTPLGPQSALSPNQSDETLEGQQNGSSSHEQLGCGWDWLTNSCKDVFNLNWCGKCHDFGNIFLHDCKCVAPLIPLPTTSRPSPPPPPPALQAQQSSQPLQVQPPPTPPRHPLFFWLI